MNRCTTSFSLGAKSPRRHRQRRWAASLGFALFASVGLGCSADDTLSEDDPSDDPAASATGGTASGGASSSGSGGRSGGGSGPAASGGRSGSVNMGSSANGGGAGVEDNETMPDDVAAEGETGIFVGMTAAHNAAREALEEGLPPLEWSPQIAEFSQQWSDTLAGQCGTIEHRVQDSYGENIAMRGSTRVAEPFSPQDAVDGWVAEVACWEFGTISGTESCDAECVGDLNSNGCGHYTQVVWRNTRRLGCGYSTCENGNFTYEIWVCNYDPPGNFIGQEPY
jgi:pathogenesis-related protein 1